MLVGPQNHLDCSTSPLYFLYCGCAEAITVSDGRQWRIFTGQTSEQSSEDKMFKRPCIEKEEQMTAVRRVKKSRETQTPTRRTLLHPAAPPQPKPQETFRWNDEFKCVKMLWESLNDVWGLQLRKTKKPIELIYIRPSPLLPARYIPQASWGTKYILSCLTEDFSINCQSFLLRT